MILHCIGRDGKDMDVILADTTKLVFESRVSDFVKRLHVDCYSIPGTKRRVNVKVPFRVKAA